MTGFWRSATAAAAIAFAMAEGVGVAGAQTDICTGLEAQLASLDRGAQAGSVNSYRQYDASVARQRLEIDRATGEARRAGCAGGFLIFQPKPEARCGALMATITRMQANLQRLSATRDRYSSDPFELSRQRGEVLRALAVNRCGSDYASPGGPPPPGAGRGSFFDMLFGQSRIRTWDDGSYDPNGQFGTFRTLCVRTCDGYYFPISFSTVPGHFSADEQTCQSMCPGSDVALYTYRNPGEDPSQMVSLSGEPYTALPTAFRYRQEYDAACTCRGPNVAALTGVSAPTGLTPIPQAPATVMPNPIARTAAGEDPETLTNREGGFSLKPVGGKTAGAAVAGVSAGNRNIRIVGPSYYYGQ